MISIITPTRCRVQQLARMLNSFINNASSKDNYEILLGVDSDDVFTLEEIGIYFRDKDVNYRIIQFERLGYAKFHEYINELTLQSKGELIWTMPDDCEVLTKNWDLEINKHLNEMYLKVRLTCGYDTWNFSIVPIFSKKWVELTGRVSGNSQTDLWLGHIADDLGIVKTINEVTCNLFEGSNGLQHDTENFYTRDKEEWEKDKAKILKYKDENIHG